MKEKQTKTKKLARIAMILLSSAIVLYGGIKIYAAVLPSQIVYDYSVEDYNKEVSRLLLARENMLVAERKLSKEKLEESTKEEDWNESDRLQLKIKNLDIVLGMKSNWEIRFGDTSDN